MGAVFLGKRRKGESNAKKHGKIVKNASFGLTTKIVPKSLSRRSKIGSEFEENGAGKPRKARKLLKKVVFGRLGFLVFFRFWFCKVFWKKRETSGEFGGMRESLGRVRVGTTQDPKNTHHGKGSGCELNRQSRNHRPPIHLEGLMKTAIGRLGQLVGPCWLDAGGVAGGEELVVRLVVKLAFATRFRHFWPSWTRKINQNR